MKKKLRLGDILVEYGYISENQVMQAIEIQKKDKSKRLGEILLESNMITEDQLLKALSKRLGIDIINFNNFPVDIEAVELIPRALCLKYKIIAISKNDYEVTVAVNDPLDFYSIEDVKSIINHQCNVVMAKRDDIIETIHRKYSEIDARKAARAANSTVVNRVNEIENVEEFEIQGNDELMPIINLVNSVILKGYAEGASDIHFEPFEKQLIIRLRVDGQLIDYLDLESAIAGSITARIKILSDLDIAEKRLPQDGHFKLRIGGQDVNIRVSTIPTVYGEKLVLRFLSQVTKLDYEGQFGMNDENFKRMSKILAIPHGIIYITGPTGSGKTTTLYMIIEKMADKLINISTIEDPVERNLAKINQIQVNNQAGLTFETGLRSLLRQDPDVILVGETRDEQTAAIAVSAAITGHLVMSTIHTNDAVSTIVRLIDMGIESYMIANSLAGVVAQRLVKKICPHCKTENEPTELEKKLVPGIQRAFKGLGCHNCNDTGYKGRISVHEILEIDNEIRKMISNKSQSDEIYEYVIANNKLKFIKDDIIDLILEGKTTVEELLRQTSLTVGM
ncbi:MAG: ATPase, T2SS/T4P/T4SS family [Proteocatella sp.]